MHTYIDICIRMDEDEGGGDDEVRVRMRARVMCVGASVNTNMPGFEGDSGVGLE